MLGSGRWTKRVGGLTTTRLRSLSISARGRLALSHSIWSNATTRRPSALRGWEQPWKSQARSVALSSQFREDTIYALSTAQGRAGIAVIRISGPACVDIYNALCPSKPLPKPRYAAVRTLFGPASGDGSDILDSEAMVLYFPGPRSVTGEDVLELHVHGGPATVKAVLSAIPRCRPRLRPGSDTGPGPSQAPDLSRDSCSGPESAIRYAEPGEFTRRAFLNDRLDLAQVESLSDALAASTEQQRRAAVRGTSGNLGRAYESWRRDLLLARGEIEALIDFAEDQHLDESPADLLSSVAAQIRDLVERIRLHEEAGRRSELLRGGIRIALLGPPNAGKSSLMNLIVGREASIVSSEAGTTRDVVEASLDIRGYLCSFADTAGFRSRNIAATTAAATSSAEALGMSPIELEGIRRAREKALSSDVIVVLASIEQPAPSLLSSHPSPTIAYDPETLQLAARAPARLIVVNKRDAAPDEAVLAELLASFRRDVLASIPGLAAAELVAISCREAAARSAYSQSSSSLPASSSTSSSRDIASGPLSSGLSASTFASDSASTPVSACFSTDPSALSHIHSLVDRLAASFASLTALPPDIQDLLGVTERQRQLLATCRSHLGDFLDVASPTPELGRHPPPPEGGQRHDQATIHNREPPLGHLSRQQQQQQQQQEQQYQYEEQQQHHRPYQPARASAGARRSIGNGGCSGSSSSASDDLVQVEPDVVLAAEHLRYAANALARITGRGEFADVDEVLGVIFERFCVGK